MGPPVAVATNVVPSPNVKTSSGPRPPRAASLTLRPMRPTSKVQPTSMAPKAFIQSQWSDPQRPTDPARAQSFT